MISKFKSRTAGALSVGVVTLAMGAAGVLPSPAAAGTSPTASTSGLTQAQKRAKAKEIKACKKKKNAAKRKACIKRVNKKYAPKPPVKVAATIGVYDDYFAPASVTVKKGQAVKWVWSNNNTNAHNVTLIPPFPSGLSASDKYNLSTPNSPSVQYTFGPKVMNKPGTYNFVCSLHSTVMFAKVKVTN
ncbi:MAG: cupredoxin domain-containing protein [Solirubrobacterales bacterium]|nr:cupredoxin domain-containing protein [Solirubrobacterales bacterium]